MTQIVRNRWSVLAVMAAVLCSGLLLFSGLAAAEHKNRTIAQPSAGAVSAGHTTYAVPDSSTVERPAVNR